MLKSRGISIVYLKDGMPKALKTSKNIIKYDANDIIKFHFRNHKSFTAFTIE